MGGTSRDHDILRGRRVLVVEDEPLIALYDKVVLEEFGCRVTGPAQTVGIALALLADRPPDAVLLDVDLRGESAEPVAIALCAAGIPFVVTTAFRIASLSAPFRTAPCLTKPIDEHRLATALVAVLRG